MLSEFFTKQGHQWRAINIGRRIVPLSRQAFEQVEQQKQPYPYPLQRQAQLAILNWKEQEAPAIWFFKFPVDEQGYLSHDALHHCLTILSGRAEDDPEEYQSQLKNNPYGHSPADEQLALVHSIAHRIRRQPASMHFELACSYFQGDMGWENWQQIPYQGLADLASLADKEEYTQILIEALPHLPGPAFSALCRTLENFQLPVSLVEALYNAANKTLSGNSGTDELALDALRAISASSAQGFTKQLADQLLDIGANRDQRFTETLLITLVGRVWEVLADAERLQGFLEQLARCGNELFIGLTSELSAQPAVKPFLMRALRDPERSPELAQALAALFTQVKGQG